MWRSIIKRYVIHSHDILSTEPIELGYSKSNLLRELCHIHGSSMAYDAPSMPHCLHRRARAAQGYRIATLGLNGIKNICLADPELVYHLEVEQI